MDLLKLMKYAKYIEIITQVVDAVENASVGGEGIEVRPTFKGKKFSILVKRTK